MVAEYQRGFNTAVNAKFFRKVLIFGGLGFFAVVTSAIFLGWRSDKRRKVEGGRC